MIDTVRTAIVFRVVAAMAVVLSLSACGGGSTSTEAAAPAAATTSQTTAAADAARSGAPSEQTDSTAHCGQLGCGIEFSSPGYAVTQSAQSAVLTVTRPGPATAAVSVDFATADGTAIAGPDYEAANGTLEWAENDSTPRTIAVPINNATPYSASKTFQVQLSNPSVAAEIGSPDSATVTISGDAALSAGSLSLSAPSYAVSQSAGTATVTVHRIGGSSGSTGATFATVDDTAVTGKDFTAASGVLQWEDGDATSKTITVPISNAAAFQGDKTLHVALSNPASGAALVGPSIADVKITGAATLPAGSLHFSTASYPVAQNAKTVTVTVQRVGSSAGAASVGYSSYKPTGGTALSGKDFTAVTGVVRWASGDATAKTFTVAINNAVPFTGNKVFGLSLWSPSNGATVSNPGNAKVTISGDATAAVGSVKLSAAGYTVAQGAGTVTVTVDRAGGSAGALSVAYGTANGTAVAGTDFTAASGTLKWADGDASAKTFAVPVSGAKPFSGNKSFTVNLSGPTGGATLSSPDSAGVVITGDATAAVGTLQLAAPSDTVAQTAGTMAFSVHRTGGSAGAVSVAYATGNGTAVAGTDFTTANGTLNWADGDATSKTFAVGISNATPFAGSKSFNVALSSPSAGAVLSNPSSAAVSITGSGVSAPGSGGPSAVTNLQLINQGGPHNTLNEGDGNSLTNYQKISWNAAKPGANPIASYNIYRNGALYANTTALSYADTAATNSNSWTWVTNATVYSYNVAAVDTQGNVGPQAAQMSVYGYQNGVSNWGGKAGDLSYGGAVANYASTAGSPQGGPFDIAVDFPGSGGFLPVADAPQAPTWDLELGAFNFFVIDVNPGPTTNFQAPVTIRSRLPPGDVFGWAPWPNIFAYGPAPKANTWATYKIPLTAFNLGIGHFTGSISGTKLTVTAVSSGFVDAGGFVTGPGVPQGTYVIAFSQNASIGTFTLAGPGINAGTSVPSTQLTFQRTSMYKFGIQPNTGSETIYFNNMGFTVH
jgi:Calx-beta domain